MFFFHISYFPFSDNLYFAFLYCGLHCVMCTRTEFLWEFLFLTYVCVCACVCVLLNKMEDAKLPHLLLKDLAFFHYDMIESTRNWLKKKKNETKNDTHELTTQREAHRLRKQAHGCQGEGIVKDLGKVMCTLLHLKWINNKNLLNSTWDSAQCYALAWMAEGVWERISSVQFTQSCPTLCSPMDCSMPGFPVHHQLLKLT